MQPVVIATAIAAAVALIAVIFRAGVRADHDIAQERAEENERRRGSIPPADWDLMTRGAQLGIHLDIPNDAVTVPGQADGRFTGSLVSVETLGQINRRVTATRVAALGVFALAAQKQQDDRELYLTITGDGFQLAAHVPGTHTAAAHRFAALYNTRSGVLAQPSGR